MDETGGKVEAGPEAARPAGWWSDPRGWASCCVVGAFRGGGPRVCVFGARLLTRQSGVVVSRCGVARVWGW